MNVGEGVEFLRRQSECQGSHCATVVDCVCTLCVLDVEEVGHVAAGRRPALSLWKAGVGSMLFLETALKCLGPKPVDYLMLALPPQLSLRSEDNEGQQVCLSSF